MRRLLAVVLGLSLFITSAAQAAFITTNEAQLDAIFSQASFGNTPIDIRIGAPTEIVAPSLLDITTNAEVSSLFGMHVGAANVVNFYFIDTISACGGSMNPNIVGCGETPGNDFVVESTFAAGAFGAELLAHELGHNLGLPHMNGNILMDPFLNGFTTITAPEVATIFNSPLVQQDTSGFWIQINPVLIVAQASVPMPTPSTLALLLIAFTLIFSSKRKNI